MSTSTVALTIEMPSLDASLSWNALESLVDIGGDSSL